MPTMVSQNLKRTSDEHPLQLFAWSHNKRNRNT